MRARLVEARPEGIPTKIKGGDNLGNNWVKNLKK